VYELIQEMFQFLLVQNDDAAIIADINELFIPEIAQSSYQ
jgi:hypothetical protein